MDMRKLAIRIISLIVIAAMVTVIAAVVTDKIDSAGDIPAGSAWNSTENPGIYTGADLLKDWWWLAAIVVFFGVVAWALYKNGIGGGGV